MSKRSLEFFWFLPTHGDGYRLGEIDSNRFSFSYSKQIACAVDQLGYDGLLIPTGHMFEEPWVTATGLALLTYRIKLLVAAHPSVVSPVYTARQTVTLGKILGKERLLLNIVVGGNPEELKAGGIFLSAQERYKQAGEFLEVYKSVLTGKKTNFTGDYYKLESGQFDFLPQNTSNFPLYSAGASEAGRELAAKYADTYLMWGDPVDIVAKNITDMRQRASKYGRKLRFGIRMHIVVRENEIDAWAQAENLLSNVSTTQIKAAMERIENEDAVAQRNTFSLHSGQKSKLEISPNLWAGVGLVRGGAITALVGNPETVAKRIFEYQDAGINVLIASGTPHLEESYYVSHLLFPAIGR